MTPQETRGVLERLFAEREAAFHAYARACERANTLTTMLDGVDLPEPENHLDGVMFRWRYRDLPFSVGRGRSAMLLVTGAGYELTYRELDFKDRNRDKGDKEWVFKLGDLSFLEGAHTLLRLIKGVEAFLHTTEDPAFE